MNLKQLVILIVLVVILGGAGLAIYHKQNAAQSAGNSDLGKKVLPNFPINDVSEISIQHDTNVVHLARKNDLWRVAERHDYPANFSQISGFLIKARDLKAVQTEEVGASQLPRLQLATGHGTNSPTEVKFTGANDKAIATLLLGKMHMNTRGAGGDGPGWPDGRYVKSAAAPDVSVISETFENIEPKPEQWLDKDFIKVEKARSIEVNFPVETNSWKLTRESESGTWKLADAKGDEKLDSSKISGLSNPLSSPTFNDVAFGDQLEKHGTNQPTVIKIETFDGFNYTVNVGSKTNEDYPITVAVIADLQKERTPGKDEKPEDKAKLDKEFQAQQQKLADKLKQEQGFQNWTYLVSSWTMDPLLKERSQLLEEKKESAENESKTNSVSNVSEPKLENPPLPAVKQK
ncbi:MAG TPA: DUF4340 domain-containing protein [Verrucomicrobiae bacterium]|nr:DUF4340 domain-containing protein [Verrucomicrobiae bacterium]